MVPERRALSAPLTAAEELASADCFFVTPDGAGGPILDESDVELFWAARLEAAREALEAHGAAVLPRFLGGAAAEALARQAEAWRGLTPALEGCRLGGGRGDLADLVDELPEALTRSLDALVVGLREGGGECAARLGCCERVPLVADGGGVRAWVQVRVALRQHAPRQRPPAHVRLLHEPRVDRRGRRPLPGLQEVRARIAAKEAPAQA
ncbi:unnamed protein product [Prorocentrum cordatum]|uniref:Uncharacterized protein n=1 Tax=Prorocentrum cordatum TaxID=2364126 RepID=A0ABN9S650_9DINO|nr:unnamed protein product [Polarella glacialis]